MITFRVHFKLLKILKSEFVLEILLFAYKRFGYFRISDGWNLSTLSLVQINNLDFFQTASLVVALFDVQLTLQTLTVESAVHQKIHISGNYCYNLDCFLTGLYFIKSRMVMWCPVENSFSKHDVEQVIYSYM